MLVLEILRVLAIDLVLLLAFVLTTRIDFASRVTALLIRSGLALLLLEDVIRFACGMAIGLVAAESQLAIDVIRQWVSVIGVTGAILACIALLPLVAGGHWTRNAILNSDTP